MWKKFFKDIFNKGNFKDYFKRNKFFLLFSVTIVILSLLSGFYNSSGYSNIAGNMIGQVSTILSSNNTLTDNFLTLFVNNFCSDIYIMGLGIIVSIPSVLLVVYNSVLVGYVFATQPFWQAFISIVPHGIFEIIALVLSLTGALLVTKMEIRLISGILSRKSMDDVLYRLKTPVKDLLLTVVLVLVLLILAALIESFVTPVLLHSL